MNIKDLKALNAKNSRTKVWRTSIVEFLMEHPGSSRKQIYAATRPEITDASERKINNDLSSQLNYLYNDGYVTGRDNDQITVLTQPHPTNVGEFQAFPECQEEVERILQRKLKPEEIVGFQPKEAK